MVKKFIHFGVLFVFIFSVVGSTFLTGVSAADPAQTLTNTADKDGSRTERIDLRTEYNKVFQVKNSKAPLGYTLLVESHGDKIHYKSGNKYIDIDSIIIPYQSGKYTYKNKSNDFTIQFGKFVNDGFQYSGNGLSIIVGKLLINDTEVANSSARIDHNTIRYVDILPNIDLLYSVTATGFSKEIILKNKDALANNLETISLEILQSNRDLKQSGGEKGSIAINGLPKLNFFNPKTYDAKGTNTIDDAFTLSGDDKLVTIKVDTEYLQSKDRIFPIAIDPGATVKPVTEDTFVASTTDGTPQGGISPRKSNFVGDYYDTTVGVWYYGSKSYLKFPGISQGVINARLKVDHYGTTGSNYTATIRSVTGTIDEDTMDWPGLGLSGNHGTIYFPNFNNNSTVERVSNDISGLVNGQIGSGRVQIGLSGPGGAGIVFCSKDGINNLSSGHTCNNPLKPPVLEYELNMPPAPPVAITPDNNSDLILNCDASAGGTCGGGVDVTYTLGNIQDGDHAANDPANQAYYRVQLSNDNSNFYDHGNWQGPTYDTRSTVVRTNDGKYYWRGILRDEGNQLSDGSSSKYILVDSTPPSVPIVPDLPAFSRGNQISITLGGSNDNVVDGSQIAYYLQVSSDPTFSDPTKIIATTWQTNNTLFQVAGLQDDTTYYYRAKAKDRPSNVNKGNISDGLLLRAVLRMQQLLKLLIRD